MGHAESKASRIPPTLPPSLAKSGLPHRFTIAYKKSLTKLALLLAEPSQDPSFMVTVAGAGYGAMVLHAGPSADAAPLAHVHPAGKFAQDFTMTLPLVEGGTQEQILRYRARRSEQYWFAMQVPGGGVERFEWRRSHGSEVRSMGQSRWGWKLVRTSADDSGSDTDKPDREDGRTSDGKEIVAVWASASKSLTKVGEFEFRGSGAGGELGQAWAMMAVLSCLCIWQKEYQTMLTTAAVA